MKEIYDKIMSKVEKTNYCWNWIHSTTNGYGRVYWKNKFISAHRTVYEYIKGPIPAGMFLDHLCRNRSCVNPDHLEIVTAKQNVLRGIGVCADNLKKTHCKNGHEFTTNNLLANKNGKRVCKICINILKASYRRKKGMQVGLLRTHCKNGHEYTPENTSNNKKSGWRTCKTCYQNWYSSRKNNL